MDKVNTMVRLTGMQFLPKKDKADERLEDYEPPVVKKGDTVVLVEDRDNPHDGLAIKVVTAKGKRIGYIPAKKENPHSKYREPIRRAMLEGNDTAVISDIGYFDKDNQEKMSKWGKLGDIFHVAIEVNVAGFTGPLAKGHIETTVDGHDIMFYPDADGCRYYTMRGEPMIGSTTYVKQMTGEKDLSHAKTAVSEKTGISEDIIDTLWTRYMQIAGDRGSIIHEAADFKAKYHKEAAIIATFKDSKGEYYKNYTNLPGDDVSNVIDQFFNKFGITITNGEIISEAFIVDFHRLWCTAVDRLILYNNSKRCRIQDIKTNSKMFVYDKKQDRMVLNKEKLRDHSLQVSFSASILKKAGYEPDMDADILHWDWVNKQWTKITIKLKEIK